jgi:ATP-dependent DNA helicase RecQ
MGVDKADVRSVIHACLPESPQRWYQEIGRAARDGHQGLAVCLFTIDERSRHRSDVDEAYNQATGSWLTRDKAELRWRALIERRVSSSWNGARQRMTLDLDAVREGLRAQTDNDYNRNWNRTLLTLMQRADVLEIVHISMERDLPGSLWEIEIKDATILSSQTVDPWDRIFEIRNSEQAAALSEINTFKNIMMRPQNQCAIQTIFRLIQRDPENDVPHCGRCLWCRNAGETPPTMARIHGLEYAWPNTVNSDSPKLPTGFTLIVPEDAEYREGIGQLLNRLAAVGFEQFLVPHELSVQTAEILRGSTARFGLVLGHDEWVGPASNLLARLPTAVLLPLDENSASKLLRRLLQFNIASPDVAIAVVAMPERQIHDRRLDQTVSSHAPYAERLLDAMTVRGPR